MGPPPRRLFALSIVVVLALAAGAGATPPTLSVPAEVKAEATTPIGAVVEYTATATNSSGNPLPVNCTQPSGSVFPIGTTQVTCEIDDDELEEEEQPVSKTFPVIVEDTTPPTLTVPAPIEVVSTTGSGVTDSDPAVAAFLEGATATDVVDLTPTVTTDAPATFPVGTTTVTFTATDDAANVSVGSSTVTVTAPTPPPPPPPPEPPPPPPPLPPPPEPPPPPPPEPTPPPPPPPEPPPPGPPPAPPAPPPPAPAPSPPPPADPDVTPPGPPSAVKTIPGNRRMRLTWTLPDDADLAEVTIARSRRGAVPATVYRGMGTSFTDRRLRNGVTYRYVLTSRDQAGNVSPAVAVWARPRVQLLRAPANGAVVSTPPVLRWAAIARATYYNVQVWRDGHKVLSRWPSIPSFALRSSWIHAGGRYALTAGSYVWYVWPGYGRRAAVRYGGLLGSRTFTVPAP